MADNLSELQREWREQVLQRLNSLAEGQERLARQMATSESTFIRESHLEKIVAEQHAITENLSSRINKLEDVYMKAIGAGVVIQILFAVLIALWNNLK
jgi:ABC-type transport system involved in cytochrome c biogenesis permease subunit